MNLPEDFVQRMRARLGDEWGAFAAALGERPAVSVRWNDKCPVPSEEQDRVPWCEEGRYLTERPVFTLDPLLHAGCYYVQEASSMFVAQALKQHVPHDALVLDLCAAPGGKSTLVSQHLMSGGMLVANEIMPDRARILAENVQKWGNANVVVTSCKPAELGRLHHWFDAVLVDAPCSGEGMFRKDEEALRQWSMDNVRMCAARQREILNDVWDALRLGGVLIYSTCTYNEEENEDNVSWLLTTREAELLNINTEHEWNIVSHGVGYHFYPHRVRGEGFYLAAVRKGGNEVSAAPASPSAMHAPSAELGCWVNRPEDYAWLTRKDGVDAVPRKWGGVVSTLCGKLRCLAAGVCVAETKGRDFRPAHALAVSKALNRSRFVEQDVDLNTALGYLRGEVLRDMPAASQPGADKQRLLTYRGVPIGWARDVGNRWNNLYPDHWRIRMKSNPND